MRKQVQSNEDVMRRREIEWKLKKLICTLRAARLKRCGARETGGLKVGTLIPVRIFVGAGSPAETTYFLFGEFDSGSERTLAAWIRHASRTRLNKACFGKSSGERVSNT